MAVVTKYLNLFTKGNADVIDLTGDIGEKLADLKIKDGIVNISCLGSTGAVTTCEFEPGLVQDIKDIFDKLIPKGRYHHDQAWGGWQRSFAFEGIVGWPIDYTSV